MRWAPLLVLLAGCPQQGSNSECMQDTDCTNGDVCARGDDNCVSPSEVRAVKATWTVKGMPASDAACVTAPDFYIRFRTSSRMDSFGYSPVPCKLGQFTMDKLPTRFFKVELGIDNGNGFGTEVQAIDSNGIAAFDMQL
jgi:hypothetical protein